MANSANDPVTGRSGADFVSRDSPTVYQTQPLLNRKMYSRSRWKVSSEAASGALKVDEFEAPVNGGRNPHLGPKARNSLSGVQRTKASNDLGTVSIVDSVKFSTCVKMQVTRDRTEKTR